MGGQVVYTSRLSSDYPISLPAIAILRSRVALTVIPLLTFKLRHGKGQIWHNATIPLLRFFEGGRRLTMGSHLLIPTTMPSFGKSYVHVIITCDPFWHVPHVSEA